jgi:molybdopterin-guanine dinucleotide biosynthesis protein A
MGTDKALLKLDGITLLERQVALARSLSPEEVWIVGRAPAGVREPRARGLPDDVPGEGPLGGLASVLRATHADHVLLVAVDMPALTAEFLRLLLEQRADGVGVVPRTRGGWEPVVAIYPRALAAPARAALEQGRRSMHAFVDAAMTAGRLVALDVEPRHEPLLVNWNAPGDLGER